MYRSYLREAEATLNPTTKVLCNHHTDITRYQAPAASKVQTTSREAIRLFGFVEDVGEVALATVLAVVHSGHEDTSTTLNS